MQLGVVSRVVAREELDDAVDLVVDEIASMSPLTVRLGRDAFYSVQDMGFDAALEHLGDAYHKAGNAEKAREMWEKAVDGIPKSLTAQDKLANLSTSTE